MEMDIREIASLRKKGLTWEQVGKKIGIASSTAWRLYNKEGGQVADDTMTPQINKLRSAGHSWQDIGSKLGVSSSTAWRWYYDSARDSKPNTQTAGNTKGLRQLAAKIDAKRRNGYTWEQIGDAIGMSPATAWRYHDEYLEMSESEFEKEIVRPYFFDNLNHKPLTRNEMDIAPCNEFNMIIDVISKADNDIYYYTEVKISTENHRLQTAIGQLISHRFSNRFERRTIKYQIAFPLSCKSDKCFSGEFIGYLKKELDIEILFI